MSKTIVVDGTRVLAAGESVRLFPKYGIINPGAEDEAGNIHDGERLLYINDGMRLQEVVKLPDPWIPGAYNFVGGKFVLDTDSTPYQEYVRQNAAQKTAEKAALMKKIDADADAIYADVIGGRSLEYQRAEEDAQAFKDAGYAGPVPAGVSTWATAKSWTAQAAADDILAVAAAWRQAQTAIRGNRLAKKEQVRLAADSAALASVRSTWAAFVTNIRNQLGV